ncbi:MAG: cytochrome c3 family protein [Deltaproteobacteria bacterium]|nr:cytochrome c3 family protein [Deltaproteobacteria bacterium]
MYKGFLIDPALLEKDPHFRMGCKFCHRGDDTALGRDKAHTGLVKRPSDDLKTCGACHREIAGKYGKSLHYTTAGLKNGIHPRFSPAEAKQFDEKVFEASCRSCHASCGDCHVKGPPVSGISIGLIAGHRFVKKDEGKTCAFCHGGRVYPEFTGDYGGNPDVHYEKGMTCLDCHKKAEFHGDGKAYGSKQEVKDRPACVNCHDKLGNEPVLTTRIAHRTHKDKVSCYGCHSAGEYRQCASCHEGAGATAKPGFFLGVNPRDKKTLTTLRLVPTVRDTFAKSGLKMERFDALPNYWNSPVHNIRKRTDRTRSCDVCHVDRSGFLKRENLPQGGSKANEGLIMTPRVINK